VSRNLAAITTAGLCSYFSLPHREARPWVSAT
jgi:hypothetical protein